MHLLSLVGNVEKRTFWAAKVRRISGISALAGNYSADKRGCPEENRVNAS
jgi:hypothetical protein